MIVIFQPVVSPFVSTSPSYKSRANNTSYQAGVSPVRNSRSKSPLHSTSPVRQAVSPRLHNSSLSPTSKQVCKCMYLVKVVSLLFFQMIEQIFTTKVLPVLLLELWINYDFSGKLGKKMQILLTRSLEPMEFWFTIELEGTQLGESH